MKNKILQRHRVELALDSVLEHPLTIIAATIGYGKTTAVKEWLKNKAVRTIWMSLCADDLIDNIIWHRFISVWEKVLGEKYNLKALNGFPHDIHQTTELAGILTAAAAESPIVIVCDDYHLVDANCRIRKLVERIAQEEIPNLHIVLISRHLTKFNSALLASKGICLIISTETLTFTNQEIIEYFTLNGLSIDTYLLERITKFSEGWAAALVLTQMRAQQNTNIPILDMDYLMSECFNSLFDEASRNLLAKLSFLEEFTLAEAIYILETTTIVAIVNLAIGQNAFIYFDPRTETYRMHALARTFLQKTAQNNNLDLSKQKYRAGSWLFKNGSIYEAIKYYLDMGNTIEVLDELNKRDFGHLCYLNTELFYELCLSLPAVTCTKYPIPYLHMILNFTLIGKPKLMLFAKKLLNIMEHHFKNSDSEESTFILAEIELVKSAANFSDVYKVMEHAKKSFSLFAGQASKIASKSDPTTYGIPIYTYIYFKSSGALAQVVNFHMQELVPLLAKHNIMYGVDNLLLAEYALETGNFEQAHLYAQKAILTALDKKFTCVAICAIFTLIRYNLINNRPQEAMKKVIEARELLISNRMNMLAETKAIYNTTIDLCDAYINSCLGKVAFIPEWIKSGDLTGGVFKMGGLGFINIIRSKVLIIEERWLELEALLPSFERDYQEYSNQFGLLHNGLYLSIAHYKLYGLEVGSIDLLKVLDAAEKDHIILMIAENAKYILPMLRYLHQTKHMSTKYFDKLLAVTIKYDEMLDGFSKKNKYAAQTIAFTERELEVLTLLKQGLMGQEIADTLCLSLIAVKKHLSNVYKKLGVTHKGAAIKRLYDLKII